MGFPHSRQFLLSFPSFSLMISLFFPSIKIEEYAEYSQTKKEIQRKDFFASPRIFL